MSFLPSYLDMHVTPNQVHLLTRAGDKSNLILSHKPRLTDEPIG